MKQEDIQKAEYLLTALNKSNFSITGIELIQYARGFEWLAKEIHEAKNPVVEKMDVKEEPKVEAKKQKLKG